MRKAAKRGRAARTHVLTGMGGVGKTQLAAQFVRRLLAHDELDVLVWVTPSDRSAVIAAYAEAGRKLLLADGSEDTESAATAFANWMEWTDKQWLVVLDDLESPAAASGWWPPSRRQGRTLVTTRRRDGAFRTDERTVLDIDLFTPDEATEYLLQATGSAGGPRADAAALAEELGFLPLATAQAAAFIRESNGINCATYRQLLSDRRRPLAALLPPEDALPDDHRVTVAAAWAISVDAANAREPRGLAGSVLTVAALLEANIIPDRLFVTEAVMSHLAAATGSEIKGSAVTEALRNLNRLSLIAYAPTEGVVRVHALVQRATRDQAGGSDMASAAEAAAEALVAVWPDIERDAGLSQVLRANAASLYANTGDLLISTAVHPVLFRATRSLGDGGQAAEAVRSLGDLLSDCMRVLGPRHADTLTTRNNMAWWRGEAGDVPSAIAEFQELLADRTEILGPYHVNTLATRHNLAVWLEHAGDLDGAITTYEDLLADYLTVLGPEHIDTLNTRSLLALARGRGGDYPGAVVALEELVTDQIRALGEGHPSILNTRSHLALAWAGAGNHRRALEAEEVLLVDQTRVLGPDHPWTLITRFNLALTQWRIGWADRALATLEGLLADEIRVLGPKHIRTMDTSRQLDQWRARTRPPHRHQADESNTAPHHREVL